MGSRLRLALIGVLTLLLVGRTDTTAAVTPAPLPHVTLIGDSVPEPIQDVPAARSALAQGIELDVQATPCRKLVGASCPFLDVRPPTVIELVQALGPRLGQTVIVSVGYNDDPARYEISIEQALASLQSAGVTRVLWATLKVDRSSYADMNDALRSTAERHPELTVIDWDSVSKGHPEWFQPDGLHPNAAGAVVMAHLFHDALVGLGIPAAQAKLRVATASLPRGRVGGRYAATLHAAGGTPPYRWSPVVTPPRGLQLTTAGHLIGVPTTASARLLSVRVADSSGSTSMARFPLRITSRETR